MEYESLMNLGLSKNEAKIYLALVKLGSSSVSQIAQTVDVHRVNIYDALKNLQEKGLVGTVVKVNKKYFEAASPNTLREIIKDKQDKIEEVKNQLPLILKSFEHSKNKQDVHIFKGITGIKTVFKDILDSNPKEILDFGATKGAPIIMGGHMKIWHYQRINKKIPMKILVSTKVKGELPKFKGLEYKYVEQEFNNLTSTVIYSDKITILMWTEDPLAILINSNELAGSYKNFFGSLWKIAKR